jgi:hypothetical protein
MPVSPAALRKLISTKLSKRHSDEAHRQFSASKTASANDQLSIWFGPNATPANIKQVIISSDETSGVHLLYKGIFTVVSNVRQELDSLGNTIFTGHLGDDLLTIMPTEVNSHELFGNACVLLMKDDIGEPNLDDLMASIPASDVYTDDNNVEKTLLGDATTIQEVPYLTSTWSWPSCQLPSLYLLVTTSKVPRHWMQLLCMN